jgi:hypothetical protein
MADVRFVDHSAAVKARIVAEMTRRLERSCILVENRAKEIVSSAYPPASSPGEPPAKRTGHLRRNIAHEVVGLTGRVGSNLSYSRHLELGTMHIAPRPWLRPALLHSQQRIEAILGAPIV